MRRRTEHHELALNVSLANSDLTGNGPAPLALLAQRRQAVFTYPDETKTSLALLTVDSSQYYRGDEANLLRPLPGYGTLNARGSYQLSSRALLFVRVDNALNGTFETFGLLGEADEVIPGAESPRYAAPGPPRSVWAGVDVQLSP